MSQSDTSIGAKHESTVQRFARNRPKISNAITIIGVLVTLIILVRSAMGFSHPLFGVCAALALTFHGLFYIGSRPRKNA